MASKSVRSEEQHKESHMQDGHNRIPGDVILEIASHLGPRLVYISPSTIPTIDTVRYRTLRSLALVCRQYHHYLLPFLFDVIYVCRGLNPGLADPLHFGMRFCKGVVDGDDRAQTLAAHVKAYIIVNAPREQPSIDQEFAIASKGMALFPNLRELYVSGLSITNNFLSAAASLPPLQVLCMEGCSVATPLDESLLKKFSALQITHLYHNLASDVVENSESQRLFQHFPMSRVQYLTSLSRTHFYLLNGLASSHTPMDQLEHVKFNTLESDEAYPDALSDFLKVVPALKTLHIEEIQHQIEDPEEFDVMSSMTYPTPPNLEHIHAHLRALMAIIPGSSVSSIGIAREDTWPEMPLPIYDEIGPHFWTPYVEAFIQSRKPIVSMDVPMDLYTSIHFAKYFPALRTLTIRPKHFNWYNVHEYNWSIEGEDPAMNSGPDEIIALFLGAWDSHPELTELQFLYDIHELNIPVIHERTDAGTISREGSWELSENTLNSLRQRIHSLKSVTFLNRFSPNFGGGQIYRFSVR